MVKIKICGITNPADATAAIDLGVDALGFVFAPSPRHISPELAGEICAAVPPFVAKVGVFVDEDADTVRTIAETCGLDALQFHGAETPEYCRGFGRRAVKAFRIKDFSSINDIGRYGEGPFVLDTFVEGQAGGTGRTFNWDIAALAATRSRIILSGGLDPANVSAAINKVKPYAVDASSGIEEAPGKKDIKKMTLFVDAARKAGDLAR